MNRVRQIPFEDFELLLLYAQEQHNGRGEPIPALGEENKGRINSCLVTPFQSFGGKYLYKGFLEKAAILFFLIAKGHALQNGNKRMAVLCLGYFYFINKQPLKLTDLQLYQLATHVAQSEDKDVAMTFIMAVLGGRTKAVKLLPAASFK